MPSYDDQNPYQSSESTVGVLPCLVITAYGGHISNFLEDRAQNRDVQKQLLLRDSFDTFPFW